MAAASSSLVFFLCFFVFFVVVVNAFLPGWTVRWLARRIGLEAGKTAPQPVVEISSSVTAGGELLSFYIDSASAAAGSAIADLPFPEGTSVLLIVRGERFLAPKGNTILMPGDHVHVFADPSGKSLVQLIFGGEESG